MEISKFECGSSEELNIEDLTSRLSQIVLTQIDEEAKRKHKSLESLKEKTSSLKEVLKKEKEELSTITSELSRQKALSRVLNVVETLRREGALNGQNRTKIFKILETVENKNFHDLRLLEERLGAYLPER